ncbi:MAG: hypothetical protein VW620_04030 [Rhodospirillales bacterium]
MSASPSWRAVADRLQVVQAPGVSQPDTKISSLLAELPVETLRRWVQTRITTDKSTRGLIVATIQKAEATQSKLVGKSNVLSIFDNKPTNRRAINLALTLSAFDSENKEVGKVNVEVQVASNFSDNSEPKNQRLQWEQLLTRAIENLDIELSRQLPKGFPDFEKLR